MCWNGHSEQKKVAEKDIEVYKIGRVQDNRFICEFRNFSYKKGVPNEELVLKEICWMGSISINEGYHSYKRVSIRFNSLSGKIKYIYRGYKIQPYLDGLYDLATFIIPKGSIYYENLDGEIVSSNIVYTGRKYVTNPENKFNKI